VNTEDYDTLTEAINALRKQGYTEDYNLLSDCIECKTGNYKLSPKDFQVDKVFRFEGPTDPADEAVLYAISSPKRGTKGLLVNAYGIYADEATNDLVEKLSIKS
jgi:hypothetical protein